MLKHWPYLSPPSRVILETTPRPGKKGIERPSKSVGAEWYTEVGIGRPSQHERLFRIVVRDRKNSIKNGTKGFVCGSFLEGYSFLA